MSDDTISPAIKSAIDKADTLCLAITHNVLIENSNAQDGAAYVFRIWDNMTFLMARIGYTQDELIDLVKFAYEESQDLSDEDLSDEDLSDEEQTAND